MKWTINNAILATLAYAELFEFPLKEEEIQRWLITDKNLYLKDVSLRTSCILHKDNFYSLRKINEKVRIRKSHLINSEEKWNIARSVTKILKKIPTIQMIGVSGGLAMNNAGEEDDIDLFFVVLPGTIWISRLCVLIILQIIGRRRKRNDAQTRNKICSNMFIDTNHLTLTHLEQDLYSAHEVLQMVPLFEKDTIYNHFLQENKWVRSYLYNAWAEKTNNRKLLNEDVGNENNFFLRTVIWGFLNLEKPVKVFQAWYIKQHQTSEIVSDSILRFHPHDVRIYIRQKYPLLLKKYKVPLDSSFFNSLQ